MDDPTPRERFLASLARCSKSEDFLESFYNRFLASSEEVREKFKHTDFERQHRMLQRSLELCAGATTGEPEALRKLSDLATTHDSQHHDIRPELYDLWLDSMIETAAQFDSVWHDEIEQSWRRILGHLVEHMKRKYR